MLNKFKNEHPNLYLTILSVLFSFVLITCCSAVTSFIFPFVPSISFYNDASMFYTMGKSMLQGLTPYVEIYDHKGLYIFYYTALSGLLGKFGVYLIQLAIMSVVFAFIYKSIKLFSDSESVIFVGFFFFIIAYSFTGQTPGDVDLELPFNAIMFYFYIKGMKNNSYKDFMIGNIFLGISTGIALNTRVSDSLLPLGFMIYFFVRTLMDKKNFKYFIRDALIVLGSIIVMSIPTFLHAYLGDFLLEMVDAVYLSNFKYISSGNRGDGFGYIVRILLPIVLILISLVIYFKRKELKKDEIIFFYVSAGVSFFIEFVLAHYPHYLIVLFPYLSIIIARIASLYFDKKIVKNITTISFASLTILGLLFNPILLMTNYEVTQNNLEYINKNISKEDKDGHTLIFGCAALYIDSGINIGYGDFAAQSNHAHLSENFSSEAVSSYLSSEESKYIIVAPHYKDFVFKHIEDINSYLLIDFEKPVNVEIYKHIF